MKKAAQFIVFLVAMPLVTILSLLPMRVLYIFSNLLYLFIYRIAGFRKDVVRGNLQIAFPGKSEAGRLALEKAFYRHLADVFVEMIKTFSISQRKLNRRFYLKNPELINRYFDQGKSVIVYGGHQGNWEWIFGVGKQLKHKSMAIYKPLSNPFINRWVLHTRSKFGFDLVPTYRSRRYIDEKEMKGEKIAYGFLGDQNPLPHKAKLWLPFFGKEVPVQTGAEELAKRYDIPVVFMEIRKLGRGYYEAELFPLAEEPRKTKDFEITVAYFTRLEESIRRQPAYYYWIHRRFKHARN
jgi:KDO2-lipid IV(A) lauroyltransferase